MTCTGHNCLTIHGMRAHTAGCPEYLGLPDHPTGDLCPEWPKEFTEGPCILDNGHPEPEHVNLEGLAWVTT